MTKQTQAVDLGPGSINYSMKFHTWQFQSFNFIHKAWYDGNLKIIPDCLEMYLTPLAFQLLLMDDQTMCESGGILIQWTKVHHGYDSESSQKLHRMLERKFNLTATARDTGNNQYTIYFPKDQVPRIIELVPLCGRAGQSPGSKEPALPHFCKSMYYKLGLDQNQNRQS